MENNSTSIGYGIRNSRGKLTLGIKGDGLNSKGPYIKATGIEKSKANMGIVNNQGNINFYDGVIQGTTYSIRGGFDEIEVGTEIKEEITEEYKKIYLENYQNNKYFVENVNTKEQFYSIQEAVNADNENNCELKILENFDLKDRISIPENKIVKIDLNGKILTNKYFNICNYGNLEITDTKTDGKINNIVDAEIKNLGEGNIKITGGSIVGSYLRTIYNDSNGVIEISNGSVSNICEKRVEDGNAESDTLYNNRGTIRITGGKVISNGQTNVNVVICNQSEGIVEIKGGIIEREQNNINASYLIKNSGSLEITGGIIRTNSLNTDKEDSNPSGIINTGSIKMTGGLIDSVKYGIENFGTVEMNGGTIEVTESFLAYGIENNNSKAIITLGTKSDGIINTQEPLIKATASTYRDGYGIYNEEGILNFYDGIIEGSSRAISENSLITDLEETQKPQYSEDYKIYSYGMEETNVAKIGDVEYLRLQDAIDGAKEGDIIKIIRGIQYTSQDSTMIIPNDKNVIIDLQNHPIISAISDSIFTVEGGLKIIDTSGGTNGKIISSNSIVIYVKQGGTLEITKGSIENVNSLDKNTVIQNEGTLNVNGGTIVNNTEGCAVNNLDNGIVNIYSGLISSTDSVNYGYSVYNAGNVNLLGGKIEGDETPILNTQLGELYIENGVVEQVYGGSVIENSEQASITIKGGTIVGRFTKGINNTSTGSINIEKVEFMPTIVYKDSTIYGIYSTEGTINIGKKDGNIDTNIPKMESIYVSENSKLNLYDGIIKGKDSAITGNINEIEENSELVLGEETIEDVNYKTITLKNAEPIAQVGSIQYYSIKKAISSISDTDTVTILRDGIEAFPVDISSEKDITIDLNGYELKMYSKIQNNGILTIVDNSEGVTGVLSSYMDTPIYNNKTLTIKSGNISGNIYGIYNHDGDLSIEGGKILNNTYGVYIAGGYADILGGTFENNKYGLHSTPYNNYTTINITKGEFNLNEYAVYGSWGREINITGISLNKNTYGIYNGGSGTINIPSGNIITTDNTAIENASSGTIVIGEEGGTPSKESPLIQAEEYAIKNTGSGTIKFYDGIIKGRTGALQGLYLYKETGYTVKTDYIDGYYCDTLTPSGTVTTVAKIGNVEYSNLQSAINACTSQEETTIQLVNSISTESTFQIEEGQNVIIDLNGKTITTSTAQTVINNAGTLAIIDTSSLQVGKIANETYNAIENSGTLTLGQDDGTVSTTCPEILGKAKAIVNTGTLNFYDGIIKGAMALEGTAVSGKPSGYIMVKTREETTGYEMLTLSL